MTTTLSEFIINKLIGRFIKVYRYKIKYDYGIVVHHSLEPIENLSLYNNRIIEMSEYLSEIINIKLIDGEYSPYGEYDRWPFFEILIDGNIMMLTFDSKLEFT